MRPMPPSPIVKLGSRDYDARRGDTLALAERVVGSMGRFGTLRRACGLVLLGTTAMLLVACAEAESEGRYPRKDHGETAPQYGPRETIFGPGGLSIFSTGEEKGEAGGGGGGIGVNSFLWRASLDTTSFMPLSSADPFGGVIITDWYSPPEAPDERFKVNVYILGRELRSDTVRAAVFRQRRDASGAWVDAPVEAGTATEFENAILTRARQLRINTASP